MNIEPSTHARLSPSGLERWGVCAASVPLSDGLPRSSSRYAAEGTVAHQIAAECLLGKTDASTHLGREITADGFTFTVDDDMVGYVQTYIDNVREYAAGGVLMVEQAVPIDHITAELGACGTADAIIITPDGELQLHDLKYGQGKKVSPTENKQLAMYASGALRIHGLVYDITRIRLVIHQPRVFAKPSEWDCTVEALQNFETHARVAADRVHEATEVFKSGDAEALAAFHQPDEEACRFCPVKPCSQYRRWVEDKVGLAFEKIPEFKAMNADVKKPATRLVPVDDTELDALAPHLDMIEDFVKAARARIEARLFDGAQFTNVKLVEGRRGSRAWTDEQAVTDLLRKSFRLKVEDVFDLKLISPTKAEKLLAKDSPKRWAKLQDLVHQPEGKPSVAPITDPRPALNLKTADDEFAAIPEADAGSITDLL